MKPQPPVKYLRKSGKTRLRHVFGWVFCWRQAIAPGLGRKHLQRIDSVLGVWDVLKSLLTARIAQLVRALVAKPEHQSLTLGPDCPHIVDREN